MSHICLSKTQLDICFKSFKIPRQLKFYKKILVNIEPANTKTLILIKPNHKLMSMFRTLPISENADLTSFSLDSLQAKLPLAFH